MIPVPLVRLLALLAVLAPCACGEHAGSPSGTTAPAEPVASVTAENLLASERWWPYRVGLREAWPAPGRDEPLPPGLTGVLIRVEPSGLPRIDFGRIGKYEVPVEKTDLLERANAIRTGVEPKERPNFVEAIRSRMLDSASDEVRPLPAVDVDGHSGFLCVFVDPLAPEFAPLAAALAPLRERAGVMTILFPQGTLADADLREQLRALDWKVPFLYDFLSEPYTRTLLREGTPLPYVMLQTAEGRVLLQEAWNADTTARLAAAMNQGFAHRSGAPPRG